VHVLGKVGIAVEAEEGWESLLLCQVTRGTKDDDDGVVLELDVTVVGRMSASRSLSMAKAVKVGARRLYETPGIGVPKRIARHGV